MWIGKFRIKHDDWILEKTQKYSITARGVPLTSYTKKGVSYHTGMVFLYGSDLNKKKFITAVKKDKRVKRCEVFSNQLFVLIEGNDSIAEIFDHALFFTQPVFFEKGYEYWEVASWEKKLLVEFYNKIKSRAEVKLLKLTREFPAVLISQAIPLLTQKQQEALMLALELGYYTYPRKVSVQQLAKRAHVPRTTFQEHLRKAEEKVMKIIIAPLK